MDVARTVVHISKLPLNTNILNTIIMANNMPFIINEAINKGIL